MAFRDSYRPVDNSTGFSTVVTQPNCGVRSWFPVFNHPTLLKPFGALDDDGNVLPWRIDDQEHNYTDWVHGVHIVCKAGTEKRVTFLADLRTSEYGEETPYTRLYQVVRQLSRSKSPEFEELLKSTKDSSAAVPRVDNGLLIQGMLLMHGGKNYMAQPVINMFLVLVRTAHDALLQKLAARSNTPIDPKLEKRFASGNVVDPASGKVIQVYAAGQPTGNVQVNWGGAGSDTNQRGNNIPHYEVDILETAAPPTPLTKLNQEHWRPWNKILYRMEAGEMMEHLCSAYKPDLIMKAYRDSIFEDLVPRRIKDKYVSPATAKFNVPRTVEIKPTQAPIDDPVNATSTVTLPSQAGYDINYGAAKPDEATEQAQPTTEDTAATIARLEAMAKGMQSNK